MLAIAPKRWGFRPEAYLRMRRDLPDGTILLHMWYGARNLAEAYQAGAFKATFVNGAFSAHDGDGEYVGLGGTTQHVVLLTDASLYIPTTAVTVCFGYKKRDATLRSSSAFGIPTATAGQKIGAHLPFTDGTVYWDFGGATEDTTRESVAGLTTSGYHTWGFTAGPRGMEIWQDGALRSSNTATPTRSSSALDFRLGQHTSPGGSDLANYYWFFLHRDQLPVGLISAILRDPYNTLLEPPSPRSLSLLPSLASFAANPYYYHMIQGLS